jgi:hypothetical protein
MIDPVDTIEPIGAYRHSIDTCSSCMIYYNSLKLTSLHSCTTSVDAMQCQIEIPYANESTHFPAHILLHQIALYSTSMRAREATKPSLV